MSDLDPNSSAFLCLWHMRKEEKGWALLEIAFRKYLCISEWYYRTSWEIGAIGWLLYCWFLGNSPKKRNP